VWTGSPAYVPPLPLASPESFLFLPEPLRQPSDWCPNTWGWSKGELLGLCCGCNVKCEAHVIPGLFQVCSFPFCLLLFSSFGPWLPSEVQLPSSSWVNEEPVLYVVVSGSSHPCITWLPSEPLGGSHCVQNEDLDPMLPARPLWIHLGLLPQPGFKVHGTLP
jgi:hypothetical protein